MCSRWSRICLQEMCVSVCVFVGGGECLWDNFVVQERNAPSLFSVIWLCEITPTLPPTVDPACSRIPSAELHGPLIKSLELPLGDISKKESSGVPHLNLMNPLYIVCWLESALGYLEWSAGSCKLEKKIVFYRVWHNCN